MSMSPLSNNSRVNYTESAAIRMASVEPKKNERLDDKVSKISEKITNVKNSLSKLEVNLKTESNTLNSLRKIESEHGSEATIRLKEGRLKFGSGGHIFGGSRYKNERQEAAHKFGANGSSITVSMASDITAKKVNSLETEQQKLKSEIRGLENDKKAQIKENLSSPARSAKTSTSNVRSTGSTGSTNSAKIIKDFSLVYQMNEGCKAINGEARHLFGNSNTANRLSSSNVIAEYERTFGSDIFGKGNQDLKNTIKAFANDLPQSIKDAADAFYTPTDTNSTTFRGQGMTYEGLNTLVAQFNDNKNQIYKPGQFFSTSKKADVAKEFAKDSKDDMKVMFEIKGNSANGLRVSNGLSLGNKKTEEERLYSPKANFKINNIFKSNNEGIYKIILEEVPTAKNAKLLPY